MFGSVAGGDVVLAANEHLTIARLFDDLGLAFCDHLRVSDQGHQVAVVRGTTDLELGHDRGETVPERCCLSDAQLEFAQLPDEGRGQSFTAVEAASDLIEGKPEAAKRNDLGEAGKVGLRVPAMACGTARRREQSDLVVVAEGSHRHSGLFRQLTDRPRLRHVGDRKGSRRVRCKRISETHQLVADATDQQDRSTNDLGLHVPENGASRAGS